MYPLLYFWVRSFIDDLLFEFRPAFLSGLVTFVLDADRIFHFRHVFMIVFLTSVRHSLLDVWFPSYINNGTFHFRPVFKIMFFMSALYVWCDFSLPSCIYDWIFDFGPIFMIVFYLRPVFLTGFFGFHSVCRIGLLISVLYFWVDLWLPSCIFDWILVFLL